MCSIYTINSRTNVIINDNFNDFLNFSFDVYFKIVNIIHLVEAINILCTTLTITWLYVYNINLCLFNILSKEMLFRMVIVLVLSVATCQGSDPPKSYGSSLSNDNYQNNYEPEIQRPLAVFTERPVNVANLVLIPVVQVPSSDLRVIYRPQIDSVSKTEPIVMCKSLTKSFVSIKLLILSYYIRRLKINRYHKYITYSIFVYFFIEPAAGYSHVGRTVVVFCSRLV